MVRIAMQTRWRRISYSSIPIELFDFDMCGRHTPLKIPLLAIISVYSLICWMSPKPCVVGMN